MTSEGSVLVVRGRLDRPPPPSWMDALSDGEHARGARLTHPRARAEFLRARVMLRRVLAELLGKRAGDLAFEESARGKPRLVGGGPSFSLSHSGDLLVIAATACGDVGVDAELLRPRRDLERLARGVLTPREWDAFERTPEPLRLELVLRRFVLKEAIGKAGGEGLTSKALGIDPGEVAPVPSPEGEASWTSIDAGVVAHVDVGDCAVGAVALVLARTGGAGPWIEYRDLPRP